MSLARCVAFAAVLTSCARPSDDAFVASADRLRPSVVLVTGEIAKQAEYATGTIVASGPWGSDILTVQHAVERSRSLRVTVANSARFRAAVVAIDRDLDLALVRIRRGNLAVAALGTSAHAQPGRAVGLIGYPVPDQFGYAGLGLQTSTDAGTLLAVRHDALEVQLPIVPGESGGPIFVAGTGEIIGIAESRFEAEQSIGFALPVDVAKTFLHRHDNAHGL